MPSWWGKSSSKESKKKTAKENFIGTLHRFISSAEHHSIVRSKAGRKRSTDTTSEIGFRSRAESRSTSPSAQVARCQSFSTDRSLSHPLPLPGPHSFVTRTASEVSTSKPILEKCGKPQLFLPVPTSKRIVKRPDTKDLDGELAITSVSSNWSPDSEETADSQLNSPVGNDFDKSNISVTNIHLRALHKDHSPVAQKNLRKMSKPPHQGLGSQIQTTSPKMCIRNNYHSTVHIPQYGVLRSAPDSSVSSPSRSPMRVCPEQIPTSAFWVAKPQADVTFLGSGQCSSPGSGQTSGHNSMGGDILGHFWQHSRRGSPEYSPIPSPRMTSAGPSSRIHSGTVSPCAGGTAPGSPSRLDEGKKQRHKLPEPSRNTPGSSLFGPNNSATNNSASMPRSPGRPDNPSTPRWKKGKLIGHGTFGHVYVGFNSESGEMCAMKEVTLFMDDAKSKESAKHLGQEISLLNRLRHPNIVQYIGCEMVDEKLYIYLEYVSGGSIHKLLQEYGQFGEPAIRNYTQQILSGLAYLHSKNTVHRDIKGANILVDPNGRVKLADFGMAKHITGQSCPLSFKGSPYWMAPEVIKNSNGCGLAVDIWSLGCTVLEMATSKPPWSQYEGIAAMFKIGNSKELPAIPDHLSDDGKDFIRRCLQRDPSNRPTAAELLQHSFVKNVVPLEKLMGCGPCELPLGIPNNVSPKNNGHVRNLSTLDKEGRGVHDLRGGRSTFTDGVRTRYVSCPVSPIGSPMLNSRSTHVSGRISPSPISSLRTTSGASTPLTGGNGAIPLNQPKQIAHLHDASNNSSRTANDFHHCGAAAYNGPRLNLSTGIGKHSPNLRERIASEADKFSTQFGRVRHANSWEPCERQPPLSDYAAHQKLRDQINSNPSLGHISSSSIFSRASDI